MKKTLTTEQAIDKIRRYCAYQERSHQEVRDKLYGYGLYRDGVDEILSSLITDGYLNEERFSKSFAGGKFRMKKWGRVKISNELESKGVSPNCISIGLREIDETSYVVALRQLLENKMLLIQEENVFILRDKLSRYAIRKGYESDLVWREIDALVPR